MNIVCTLRGIDGGGEWQDINVIQPGAGDFKRWRLVEWRGEFDGQKFERVEHAEFEVLASELGLKIAIVGVLGTR